MQNTKIIKLLVLINHRNREINIRAKTSPNVFCVKIRCTIDQFSKGDLHEKALSIGKKYIHTKMNASSEDFDLVCFDKYEGHFISKKVWKLPMWKQSQVYDISKDEVSKHEE